MIIGEAVGGEVIVRCLCPRPRRPDEGKRHYFCEDRRCECAKDPDSHALGTERAVYVKHARREMNIELSQRKAAARRQAEAEARVKVKHWRAKQAREVEREFARRAGDDTGADPLRWHTPGWWWMKHWLSVNGDIFETEDDKLRRWFAAYGDIFLEGDRHGDGHQP